MNSLQAQTEIYFESGKSNLSRTATKVLDSIVLTVRSHDIFKINGHTDTIGNSEPNRRARAIDIGARDIKREVQLETKEQRD